MVDMESTTATEGALEGKLTALESSDVNGFRGHMLDFEDEKERTIAKAALSIAELSELPV